MKFTDRVYRSSPLWLQNLGVSAFGLYWRHRRFGGVFREQVELFRERDSWTEEKWQSYEISRLRELLSHAFAHVHHYREAWGRAGIQGSDLLDFGVEDLRRLPLTEKEQLRSHPADFLSTAARSKLHTSLTSGSTGTPLAVRLSTSTQQTMSAAYEVRCRNWAGLNQRMSRAMIGGRLVVPPARATPPYWIYNSVERQLYFSAFHISPTSVPHYVAALNQHRPDYLVGYASAHYFLARMIEESGLAVHKPRAILTSSESLLPEMRSTLERVYQAPVFDGYSGVECCCLASECEFHQLHLSPDVGLVEIIDDQGRQVAEGEVGEIVATGFLNFDQPLIRYRTGDYASRTSSRCRCGRSMPILGELVGRLEDTVVTPDGRETVRFHGIFVGLPDVKEGQILQESISEIVVRVVAPSGLSDSSSGVIAARFHERLGPVRVTVERVDAIPRTERGKYRAVISKVPRPRRVRSIHARVQP